MFTALRQVTKAVNSVRISPELLRATEYNISTSLTSTSFVRNTSSEVNMAKALVIIADGTEEMEAVSLFDKIIIHPSEQD